MSDTVSPEKRSAMMAGIRAKDTKPELTVRKALHAGGFRFRLHNRMPTIDFNMCRWMSKFTFLF